MAGAGGGMGVCVSPFSNDEYLYGSCFFFF